MLKIICIVLYVVFALCAVLNGARIYRKAKEQTPGVILLNAAVFCVLFSVVTFFLCYALDTGILAVPIVMVLTFLVLCAAYHAANRHAPAGVRRVARRRVTIGVNTKKTKKFLLSSGSVALAVAAVILLNLIATNLNDRFDWNIDLTESKLYSISEDTEETLDELEQEVTITILYSEDDLEANTYGSYVHTLLDKYLDRCDKLSVSYIDPYQNPTAVESYQELSTSVTEGSFIVQSGDNSRVLNLIDFYDTETDSSSYSYYVSAFRGESTLTSAILAVTSDDTPYAYILQGHNESVSSQFQELLETSGYTVDNLTLAEKDIPDNASLLILSLPQEDYTEDEINALDDYVKNGGDLVVFDGTESPNDLNNLYAYFKEWGITVEPQMVLDAEYNISDARYLFASLEDVEINDALSAKSDQIIVTPDAKPLTVDLSDDITDRSVETILSSRDTSYARSTEDGTEYDSYDKQDSDTDGPFAIAALAEYTGNDDGGQILVCSSALMMTDQLMQSTSLLNKDFLSNTISSIQPEVELISISSKSMSAEPLTLSATGTYLTFVILLAIPLLLFIYGVMVFFRRRHL